MKVIVIDEKDNVATAIVDISEGEVVKVKIGDKTKTIRARANIPFGHKIALSKIRIGEKIVKYGEVIGIATKDINEGDHVHIHNVKSARF